MDTLQFNLDSHPGGGEEAPAVAARPATRNRVSVARAVFVSAAARSVESLLADFELLPLFEHKLDRVRIVDVSGEDGRVRVRVDGHFSFLPYSVGLQFTAHRDGGYESVLLEGGALAGFSGSFAVRRVEGGCVVTHVEQYEFRGGLVGKALGTLCRPYIGWSMEGEVRRLKRLVEEPALLASARRAATAVNIDTDRRVAVWDPMNGVLHARPDQLLLQVAARSE